MRRWEWALIMERGKRKKKIIFRNMHKVTILMREMEIIFHKIIKVTFFFGF